MTLRQKIQQIIDEGQSSDDSSKQICIMLNDELSLDGNGWFEDDPELKVLFEDSDES
jgi:hypothetical protein